jgi:hypothetical protein
MDSHCVLFEVRTEGLFYLFRCQGHFRSCNGSGATESMVRSEAGPCEICGEQIGTGTGCSASTFVFPGQCMPPLFCAHLDRNTAVTVKHSGPFEISQERWVREFQLSFFRSNLLMLHICGVSKTFGEWYQKTNKTEDTNKLTLFCLQNNLHPSQHNGWQRS